MVRGRENEFVFPFLSSLPLESNELCVAGQVQK